MVMDVLNGVQRGTIGSRFHHTLVSAWAEFCGKARDESGINQVVLSGGVFQNRFLFETAERRLADLGFDVFVHEKASDQRRMYQFWAGCGGQRPYTSIRQTMLTSGFRTRKARRL